MPRSVGDALAPVAEAAIARASTAAVTGAVVAARQAPTIRGPSALPAPPARNTTEATRPGNPPGVRSDTAVCNVTSAIGETKNPRHSTAATATGRSETSTHGLLDVRP
jgi:hypothetical protein